MKLFSACLVFFIILSIFLGGICLASDKDSKKGSTFLSCRIPANLSTLSQSPPSSNSSFSSFRSSSFSTNSSPGSRTPVSSPSTSVISPLSVHGKDSQDEYSDDFTLGVTAYQFDNDRDDCYELNSTNSEHNDHQSCSSRVASFITDNYLSLEKEKRHKIEDNFDYDPELIAMHVQRISEKEEEEDNLDGKRVLSRTSPEISSLDNPRPIFMRNKDLQRKPLEPSASNFNNSEGEEDEDEFEPTLGSNRSFNRKMPKVTLVDTTKDPDFFLRPFSMHKDKKTEEKSDKKSDTTDPIIKFQTCSSSVVSDLILEKKGRDASTPLSIFTPVEIPLKSITSFDTKVLEQPTGVFYGPALPPPTLAQMLKRARFKKESKYAYLLEKTVFKACNSINSFNLYGPEYGRRFMRRVCQEWYPGNEFVQCVMMWAMDKFKPGWFDDLIKYYEAHENQVDDDKESVIGISKNGAFLIDRLKRCSQMFPLLTLLWTASFDPNSSTQFPSLTPVSYLKDQVSALQNLNLPIDFLAELFDIACYKELRELPNAPRILSKARDLFYQIGMHEQWHPILDYASFSMQSERKECLSQRKSITKLLVKLPFKKIFDKNFGSNFIADRLPITLMHESLGDLIESMVQETMYSDGCLRLYADIVLLRHRVEQIFSDSALGQMIPNFLEQQKEGLLIALRSVIKNRLGWTSVRILSYLLYAIYIEHKLGKNVVSELLSEHREFVVTLIKHLLEMIPEDRNDAKNEIKKQKELYKRVQIKKRKEAELKIEKNDSDNEDDEEEPVWDYTHGRFVYYERILPEHVLWAMHSEELLRPVCVAYVKQCLGDVSVGDQGVLMKNGSTPLDVLNKELIVIDQEFNNFQREMIEWSRLGKAIKLTQPKAKTVWHKAFETESLVVIKTLDEILLSPFLHKSERLAQSLESKHSTTMKPKEIARKDSHSEYFSHPYHVPINLALSRLSKLETLYQECQQEQKESVEQSFKRINEIKKYLLTRV